MHLPFIRAVPGKQLVRTVGHFIMQLADHLSILGLSESASVSEVKAAYRREMQKWHPDHFSSEPSRQKVATERAKKINAAFEYLSELYEKGSLPRSTRGTKGNHQSRPQSHENYRTQHTYNGKSFTPGFPDASVFEVFVKSSAFISAGYNPETRTLYLKFIGNRIYGYLDVPESVFYAFLAADSQGQFANRHILRQYPCVYHEQSAETKP
jgi:curved DNA-binding protein CbpA